MNAQYIPLPKDWPDLIRRAMIHAVSLAHFDIICAWSRTANSEIQTVRLKGQIDKLQTELALTQNQLRIISLRFRRVPAKNRPYYLPTERMEILNHKAARGWNLKQTADAFQIAVETVASWLKRKAVGFAVFRKQPTSKDVTAVLDKAVEQNGKAPKYIISDKGRQFFCANYKNWCSRNNIKPRFGAVGKYGSIAITERFIKSLKYECTNLISVPLTLDDMRHEVALYFIWYNQYRPHEYLDARTPEEVYNHSPPIEKKIFKRGSDIPKLELQLSFLDGRKHLPIIEFKKAS
ncbi:MAG: integrase core domain-containing protein [Victivallaceae bacterium]|nr:integrase core domain-containing protein [Victivallaceae bacterium]